MDYCVLRAEALKNKLDENPVESKPRDLKHHSYRYGEHRG
jgi:hypothetical protein